MSRDTKQMIIDAAFELFGRNGFHAIGIDRIIDEVGISKQTFYNHFESKDDLILAVLRQRHDYELKSFMDEFRRLGGEDPRQQLEAVFDALNEWFNSPQYRGCIFITAAAEFPSENDPIHQVATLHARELRDRFQYLATLAGASDPKELAEQLSVLMQGTITYRHITADERTVEIARQTGRMLIERYIAAETAKVNVLAGNVSHVHTAMPS